LVRAGWEATVINRDIGGLRTEPIFFEVLGPDGGVNERCYKTPNSVILPGGPAYRLKELRDFIWYKLANNPVAKFRMALLIADKRIGEAIKMEQDDNFSGDDFAVVAKEAVDWLSTASRLAKDIESKNQISQASLAYRHEIEEARVKWGNNGVEYLELLKKLKAIDDQNFETSKNN